MGTATMSTVSTIGVDFHAGNIINYLAQAYGDGFAVLREGVQNSLDKHAKNIFIRIDCPKNLIQIFDDGEGASHAEISKKFQGVGLSLKLDDLDASGEMGIGNLAGLAVAREWQLLTRDRSRVGTKFHLFSFSREELKKNKGILVHSEEVSVRGSLPGAPFTAYTMLRLLDVDELTLQQLRNQDVISRTLTDAFGNKLRARKVELRVSYVDFKGKRSDFLVKPPQFRGMPMEPDKQDTEFGEVEFHFFHSPRPVSTPSILVQHQGVYSIPLVNFFKLKILGKEVEEIFTRGYFEGEIKLGFCEITPDRSRFAQNHQLKVFVQAVETFVANVLRPLVEQLDQEGREERHKRIADQLLKKVRHYFEKHPNALPATMKSFLVGSGGGIESANWTGGSSTTKPTDPKVKKKSETPKPEPLPKDAFKKQRAKSAATGGTQKKPTPRILVLDNGLGLNMVYPDAAEGFSWHSRTESGVIEINAANNEFLDAERRGQTKLSEYMFLLLQKELTCASLNPMDAQSFGRGFESSFMTFWRASFD